MSQKCKIDTSFDVSNQFFLSWLVSWEFGKEIFSQNWKEEWKKETHHSKKKFTVYNSSYIIFKFKTHHRERRSISNVKLLFGILEFLDSGCKSWTLYSGFWTLDAGFWTLNSGRWTLDAVLWTLDSGRWTLDIGLWTLDSGPWTLSLTVVQQNQNPVFDFAWLNYWKFFGCESLRTMVTLVL